MKRKSTQQFIEDAYCIHGDKYNYKLVKYKNAHTKIKIICSEHGTFEQVPSYHLRGQNCSKCANIKKSNKKIKSTQQFIIDAKNIHGDKYDYSLTQYKRSCDKVKIICPIHGIFEQTPNNHLNGNNCPKCADIKRYNKKRKNTEQFIINAYCKHGDKYNYKLIDYKKSCNKVKIICLKHGVFEQTPSSHLKGNGCHKCAIINKRKTTQQFIEKAKKVHGDKYDYSLVQYKNVYTKVQIICLIHGIFEQTPGNHLNGNNCPKCIGRYEEKYASNDIPVYDTYTKQLSPYGITCRRNKEDNNILEVKCMYCDRWYIPSLNSIQRKIRCINGKVKGESNLYCSNECKQACPTYGQNLYPKGFKNDRTNTSREIQPELRKKVLKRDNYTCQKCGATNTILHCHHYEGIEVNPIESADADNCITLCKACHNEIHKADKCGIKDYKRKKCK